MFGLFMSTLSNFCHEFIMALITGISVCTCIDRLVEISYFLSQCSRLGSLCSIALDSMGNGDYDPIVIAMTIGS